MRKGIIFNKKPSLNIFLIISCIGISLLPVLIYVALSIDFYRRGLDSVHEWQLKKLLHEHINSGENIISNNLVTITSDYNSMPETIKKLINKGIKPDIAYKGFIENEGSNDDVIYFFIMHQDNKKIYYALQKIYKEDVDKYIKYQVTNTIFLLLAISAIVLIMLSIFIKILINKIKIPIKKLDDWVIQLSRKTINNNLPDFTYPELQHIALFIQNNLENEYKILNREEIFWRYCSHELRTPISVLGVGLDVLQKAISRQERNYRKENDYIIKLKRSVQSMSQVINNILWLGRNNDYQLSTENVDLSEQINSVVRDMKKIFPLNQGEINIKTSPFTIKLPRHIINIGECQLSNDKIFSLHPFTWNLAKRAIVRSTISTVFETTMDFLLNRAYQCL